MTSSSEDLFDLKSLSDGVFKRNQSERPKIIKISREGEGTMRLMATPPFEWSDDRDHEFCDSVSVRVGKRHTIVVLICGRDELLFC